VISTNKKHLPVEEEAAAAGAGGTSGER